MLKSTHTSKLKTSIMLRDTGSLWAEATEWQHMSSIARPCIKRFDGASVWRGAGGGVGGPTGRTGAELQNRQCALQTTACNRPNNSLCTNTGGLRTMRFYIMMNSRWNVVQQLQPSGTITLAWCVLTHAAGCRAVISLLLGLQLSAALIWLQELANGGASVCDMEESIVRSVLRSR